jgi:hypothetical protein
MKQFAKIICIAALSVAAYGLRRRPATDTTPPDATVVNRPDASSSCSRARRLRRRLLHVYQKCMANQCVVCECAPRIRTGPAA